ncbi:hypothetical protein ACRRTK_016526 [Alexandromys fortis]
MRKPVLGLVRNSPAYMCFLVMGCGPHSWFGRITHDAPGGFSNIFTDSTHLLLPGDAAGPNTKMNEVIKSSTVYLDGRFLVHSTPPRGLPEPARRVGREAAATLCCGGCGTVPGFTSRPRGGAWLASLSQRGLWFSSSSSSSQSGPQPWFMTGVSCWANEMTATVGRVPGLVSVPVSQLVLSRPCRDLGITVGGWIATAAASETTRVATGQIIAVPGAVDPPARQVATAFEIQDCLDHFRQGIFRFDLTGGARGWLFPFLSSYLCHAHANSATPIGLGLLSC